MNLQAEAYDYFIAKNYSEAVNIYLELIDSNPNDKANYWYLGLSKLLQGKSDEAQIIWSSTIDSSESDEVDRYIDEFSQILAKEASRIKDLGLYSDSLSIRQSLYEINPYNLSNLIEIILLLIILGTFTANSLDDLEIFELLDSQEFNPLSEAELLDFLEKLLTSTNTDPSIVLLVEKICKAHNESQSKITEKLFTLSGNFLNRNLAKAIEVLEMGTRIDDQNLELLMYLVDCYLFKKDPEQAVTIGKELYNRSLSRRTVDKVLACQWLMKAYIYKCTYWEETYKIHQECDVYLRDLIDEDTSNLSIKEASYYLMATGFYYPYFYDQPQSTRNLRQSIHHLSHQRLRLDLQKNIDNHKKRQALRKKSYIPERPIKIGYLSRCLKRHSVGYIARWLMQYHDRERFELYGYVGEQPDGDPLSAWYEKQFHKIYTEKLQNGIDLANQIQKDGIDILIDLDSITFPHGSGISLLKPSPIQVTWLGWDAAGLENVDYFIADPFVLPEDAQEYYAEKIWRLPQTYVAVDGFESATPTVRRDLLDIPNDAVIYFSAQATMKRHPDTIRLQMRIIQSVPNSYLVLKSMGDQESLKEFFFEMARLEGVNKDRLRFLPITNSETEHRANLLIADVILDTYPYNGATHTLETLWMEIPMVTRVGEQFAARNSYTMMINAGITEGIAWTDEEYVEWGINLGTDIDLRKQVAWKLKQGKQTAPLWNSRQFTKDMESAYEQMWKIWLESEDLEIEVDPVRDRELFVAEAELRNADAIRLAQKGKLDSAIVCWQAAILLYPEYIDAHYNLGIAQTESGKLEQAIESFQTTIHLAPNHANALYNLGLTLVRQNKLDAAIAAYHRALVINPEDIDIPLALGSAFFKKGSWQLAIAAYQSALEINPESVVGLSGLGAALTENGDVEEAINYLQSAIAVDPNDAQSYCNLGYAFARNNQMEDAVFCYHKALKLNPAFGHAFWNFNNDILADIANPLHHNFALRRQLADQFLDSCHETDKICSLVNFITNYSNSGLNDIAITKLPELERFIFENVDQLESFEVEVLYNNFLFNLNSLRDGRKLNSNLFRHVGRLYKERVIKAKSSLRSITEIFDTKLSSSTRPLRIGLLSPHFGRHPVGWCSLDVIRELSQITPHIYLYTTGTLKPDERTCQFEQVAEKYYWYEDHKFNFDGRLNQLVDDIAQDRLDVIIDLDSVTVPLGTHILCREDLAPVRLSWLGFDAPFVSSSNYWIGDCYTHPDDADQYYLEKLVRLPDSHMAVSGFEAITVDRETQRQNLGISSEQVAYLYAAPARKFNRESATACIRILQEVPDSVLLHKGRGDHGVIRDIYHQVCNELGVDCDRVKFLPSYKTEEEHRSIYSIADVFLDSYPYNGGSHNLEVLWFNLPVVTQVGEQSFAKMGYSFLQTLDIDQGIAHSWEEYIQWGIKFGLDVEVREGVKSKLIASKLPDNLSPLWNPKKLASDMYKIFQSLLEKYHQEL